MKVKATTVKPEFTPVELKLTFESMEEVIQLYVLCNHTELSKVVGHGGSDGYEGWADKVRWEIKEALGPVDYQPLWDKLNMLLIGGIR